MSDAHWVAPVTNPCHNRGRAFANGRVSTVGPQNPSSILAVERLPHKFLPIPLQSPSVQGFLETLLKIGVIGLGVYGLAGLLAPEPARPRRRRPNIGPIEAWKREYVSERDGWRCVYCGRWVYRTTRHIDHRVSRRNRGTNHLNNLSLSCAACNLEKGSLNAWPFVRTI